MSVTMRDVAHKAGVSIKTVSRVINGQGEISDLTRERVQTAINDLGYRPSRIARAMVTQKTHTVGFVVPDITNPFFPEITKGVQDLAQAKDYNIFLCNTNENPKEYLRSLHLLADQAVDGIILFSSLVSDENLKDFASSSFRPIVAVNRYFEHPGVSMVLVDNYRGARLAMTHLLQQGHTAIGMLAGIKTSPHKVRRIKGYHDALAEHGLPLRDDWLFSGAPNMITGYENTQRMLTQHPEITAIFAYNDLLALGAIRACIDLGRQVPHDCAIVGFDDIQLATMTSPSLTSVKVDKYDLGKQAMERLLAMIDDPKAQFPVLNIDVELVVRESA